jgi:tRNA U34 2-thiouridine synthase MnmA/TrmU
VIGREDELYADDLLAAGVNLIRPERFARDGVRVRAMTRYRSPLNLATATLTGDSLRLRFESPERAIAPGQLVALYDAETPEVLGSATIV